MKLLKLDIQRFSGGSYNYVYSVLDMECSHRMYDPEMNELINDLIPVLKELEWWQSCDSSEDDYRKEVAKFKKKWFDTSRDERLKEYINKCIEETKSYLYKMLGDEVK